jgi:threonine/homoserine/homoserine lactone efflux protein
MARAIDRSVMFGTHNLPLFVLTGILLNMTPGQDTFYIVGRSVAQGRRAGVLSVLGITSGCVVHTLAAAFGLSAILATSANAFLVVKFAGAMYLVYLGFRLLFDRASRAPTSAELPRERSWAIFRAGFITNVLNPKVALFFMAFLPQFVDPSAQSKLTAFLFLGAVFMFNGTLWCLILVWGASAVSRRFRATASAGALVRRAAGAMFVGLGVKLAVTK